MISFEKYQGRAMQPRNAGMSTFIPGCGIVLQRAPSIGLAYGRNCYDVRVPLYAVASDIRGTLRRA